MGPRHDAAMAAGRAFNARLKYGAKSLEYAQALDEMERIRVLMTTGSQSVSTGDEPEARGL